MTLLTTWVLWDWLPFLWEGLTTLGMEVTCRPALSPYRIPVFWGAIFLEGERVRRGREVGTKTPSQIHGKGVKRPSLTEPPLSNFDFRAFGM
jgi:hypothetical protein